jgi:hypothetical protein
MSKKTDHLSRINTEIAAYIDELRLLEDKTFDNRQAAERVMITLSEDLTVAQADYKRYRAENVEALALKERVELISHLFANMLDPNGADTIPVGRDHLKRLLDHGDKIVRTLEAHDKCLRECGLTPADIDAYRIVAKYIREDTNV